jgi:phosphoglycerate dehydrogenase-like enzyme
MLGLVKRIIPQHEGVVKGKWPRGTNLPLRESTIGIAGLGRIGKAVATRARAFGMRLLAYEPYPDLAFAKENGIELVSFEDLLKRSDFVTLHLPMSADSKHLINKKTLALMKPTAYLINTARGGVIYEPDLVDALREKRIAGAGLDVFDEEPPPVDHPLFKLDNVVLTPHAAGVDRLSITEMALSSAKAIVSFSRGEWPEEKVVNPKVKAHFQWKPA